MLGQNFLSGGGRMGALMRATDWLAKGLPLPEAWPPALQTAVSICLNSLFPMILWLGPELRVVYNDAYIPFLGPTKHPVALGEPGRVVWSEIWDVIEPLHAKVLSGEAILVEDSVYFFDRHVPGEEVYVTFSYSPIFGQDGQVEGVFCACSETTAKIVQTRRLATLQAIGERARGTQTLEHAIAAASDAMALNRYDLPKAQVYLLDAGRSSAAPAAPDDDAPPVSLAGDPPLQRAMRDALTQGLTQIATCEVHHGGPWNDPIDRVAVVPVHQANDGIIGFLVASIAPRRPFDEGYASFLTLTAEAIGKAMADALAYIAERRRVAHLEELDKAKTLFFSNVSHELRTPLTLILGPLEDALDRVEPASPLHESIERALRNGQRLLHLVNTLLTFSRVESGRAQARYEPTDIGELTQDLASNFRSACDRAGLSLDIRVRPVLHPVFIDQEMWETVVLNLLSNAIKATLEGGVRVTVDESDGAARVTVEDTGVGIDAIHMARLFERFYRIEDPLTRSHEGSGIGLALVHELVHLNGGTIAVRSVRGKGTAFEVRLPFGTGHLPRTGAPSVVPNRKLDGLDTRDLLHWLPSESSGRHAHTPAQAPENAARILVVDDNADMRQHLERILGDAYAVSVAANGEEALASIGRSRPDLVIADIMMPVLDGFGLIGRLRADPATLTLPVIVLSARAGVEAIADGLDRGADDYLVKPFSARDLLSRVGSVLRIAAQRHAAAEAIRITNERLESALETGRMAWWQWDESSDRVTSSATMAGLTGWAVDGQGSSPTEGFALIHPTDRGQRQTRVARALHTLGSWHGQFRIQEKDGEVRWLEERGQASRRGETMHLSGLVWDVTARKRSEEAHRVNEERLRSAVEVGRVGLWDWNIVTGDVHWSDEHFRLQGYDPHEVAPSYEAWLQRLHTDDRARAVAVLETARDHRGEYAHEFRTLLPDGSIRWLAGRGRFFYDDSGTPLRMIGAMIDTTAARSREEQQEVLVAELQHRTQNLLAVVRAIATDALGQSTNLEQFADRFDDRLSALSRVQRLLSQRGDGARVSFDALIASELAAMDGSAERIQVEGPTGISLRSGTVQTLAMALHELATNALKYGALAQPEGRLTIRWWLAQDDSEVRRLHIDWRETDVVMPVHGAAPQGTGQGRRLIERALPYQLGAETALTFTPDGVHCRIVLPLTGGPRI